jgi:hypothetical protein
MYARKASTKTTCSCCDILFSILYLIDFYFCLCFAFRSIESMSIEHTFANTWVTPTSATPVKMYRFSASFLQQLSQNPTAKETWLAVLTSAMAVVATTPYYDDTDIDAFVCDKELSHLVESRSPLFDVLASFEEPRLLSAGSTRALKRPVLHLLNSYRRSFWMPWPLGIWPAGLRHRLPPPHDPNVKATIKRKTQILRESVEAALDVGLFNPKEFEEFLEDINEDVNVGGTEVPYGTFPPLSVGTAGSNVNHRPSDRTTTSSSNGSRSRTSTLSIFRNPVGRSSVQTSWAQTSSTSHGGDRPSTVTF